MAKAADNRALIFILITVLIDVIGLGIIIPVMPSLLQELTGEGISAVARYAGWLLASYALMQFLFAPIMGSLSDRFGRRPVLLIALFALGIDYIVLALAPNLIWLFIGRIIAGMAGATYTPANAYIADITPEAERAKRFGLIGAAWGVGFVLGPVIGGLFGELGTRVPFYAAAGLALANFVFGYFMLPETLAPENRRSFSFRDANPVGAVLAMSKFPIVLWFLVALLFYQVAHDVNPATWSYYTAHRFDWTPADIGFSLGVVGVSVAIVQGGVIGPFIKRFGERAAIFTGLTVAAVGFFGFALTSSEILFLAAIVPFAFVGLAMPAMRSQMSAAVPADRQGELQGVLTSLASLTAIGAPLVATELFARFSADDAPVYFPGAAFLMAAGLMVISIGVVRVALRRVGASS